MSSPSDHLLVEAPGSDTLVVYLSALNVGDGTFNWRRLGQAQGSHALFLSDKRNHWYLDGLAGIGPAADTASWIKQTAARLGVSRIRFIGSSMGGYGALFLAAAVDAPALAFSPEAVLDRPGSRSSRFRRGGTPQIARGDRATVIFGESDPHDLWAARRLAASGATIIGLRGVDHYASTALNQSGVLPQVLDRFIRDGSVTSLDGLIQPPRAQGRWFPIPSLGRAALDDAYVEAVTTAADGAARRDGWDRVEVAARAAVARHPTGDLGHYLLGQALLLQGRAGEAIPSLAAALALHERNPEYRHLLGSAFRKAGLIREAIDAQEHVLRRSPRFGRAHYALALILDEQGEHERAIAHLRRAVECEPRRQAFRDRLAMLEARTSSEPSE